MIYPPLYTDYAEYYDIIYREYLEKSLPKLVDFLIEVFNRDSERRVKDILDIACGTGGPTIELAKRGFKVVGIDLSERMIQIARRKSLKLGISVDFRVKDMRTLDFNEQFDAVTCLFTSINYNLSDNDIKNTMTSVYKALRYSGVFIADFPNPFYNTERWLKGQPVIWRVENKDVNVLVIDAVRFEGNVSQILDWNRTIIVSKQGKLTLIPDQHSLRAYTANELKLYAKIVGFKKVKLYGDLRITREEPREAKRLFLVAIK